MHIVFVVVYGIVKAALYSTRLPMTDVKLVEDGIVSEQSVQQQVTRVHVLPSQIGNHQSLPPLSTQAHIDQQKLRHGGGV